MNRIHKTAIISPKAQLDSSVEIGPYTIINEHVRIDAGTKIGAHCIIDGHTTIGKDNHFYRFCSIGGMPQDKKYQGEDTKLEIGHNNMVREYVTINTGTVQDVGVTRIGNENWIMAYVHIAHDCQIGSNTIIANSVQLAGHIHVGDWAVLGGLSAVHQFVRIGEHAMVGGTSSVRQDIPPYFIGAGDPFRTVGVNSEGLKRRAFTPDTITALKRAYRLLYRRQLNTEQAIEAIETLASEASSKKTEEVIRTLTHFLLNSKRGFARP